MKYVGLGLFWVVFVYIALKILAWVWPLVALAEAGFMLVSWGLTALVVVALLWIIGKALS